MENVSIKGLDKAEVLAALVNYAQPLGMGFLQDDGKPMTKEEAQARIDGDVTHDSLRVGNRHLYFDYVKGRPIKSDLSGDEINPALYDRDQGQGACAEAIKRLRASKAEGVVAA